MHVRGELPAETDPDKLALAMLAAMQGGLVLAQVRRHSAPLEAALDTSIDYVESLIPAHPRKAGRRS